MEQTTEIQKPQSQIQRAINIIVSPSSAIEAIKAKPNYLLPLAIIWVIGILSTLLTKDLMAQYTEMAYSSAGLSADQIAATKETMSGLTQVTMYITMLVLPLAPVVKGLVSHLLSILFSGKGTMGSTVSLMLNAYIIQMVGTLISLPIMLMTQNALFSFSPALLLPVEKMATPLFSTLASLNIFTIWYMIVSVMGIKKIHEVATWKAVVITLLPFILILSFSWIGVLFGAPSGF